MDHLELSEARRKQFRRPLGIDRHSYPPAPSKKECLEAIEQGLNDRAPRKRKDLVNIVDRWAQDNDPQLDEATRQGLAARSNAVHNAWRTAQYIRFVGLSNNFQTAAQNFLEYARSKIRPEEANLETLREGNASPTPMAPTEIEPTSAPTTRDIVSAEPPPTLPMPFSQSSSEPPFSQDTPQQDGEEQQRSPQGLRAEESDHSGDRPGGSPLPDIQRPLPQDIVRIQGGSSSRRPQSVFGSDEIGTPAEREAPPENPLSRKEGQGPGPSLLGGTKDGNRASTEAYTSRLLREEYFLDFKREQELRRLVLKPTEEDINEAIRNLQREYMEQKQELNNKLTESVRGPKDEQTKLWAELDNKLRDLGLERATLQSLEAGKNRGRYERDVSGKEKEGLNLLQATRKSIIPFRNAIEREQRRHREESESISEVYNRRLNMLSDQLNKLKGREGDD